MLYDYNVFYINKNKKIKKIINIFLIFNFLFLSLFFNPINYKIFAKIHISEKEINEKVKQYSKIVPLKEDLIKFIVKKSNENGVPDELTFAVIETESNFNIKALSKTNDYGLMQINYNTGKYYFKKLYPKETFYSFKLFNPYINTNIGTYYLGYLYIKFNGNLERTLTSYNRGIKNANRYASSRGTYDSIYARKVIQNYYKYQLLIN